MGDRELDAVAVAAVDHDYYDNKYMMENYGMM